MRSGKHQTCTLLYETSIIEVRTWMIAWLPRSYAVYRRWDTSDVEVLWIGLRLVAHLRRGNAVCQWRGIGRADSRIDIGATVAWRLSGWLVHSWRVFQRFEEDKEAKLTREHEAKQSPRVEGTRKTRK